MARKKTESWSDDAERQTKDADHLKGMEKASGDAVRIVIPPLDLRVVKFSLEGDSPLICHRFSEKAKKMIRDKQSKQASPGREKRNPEAEYEASFYRMPDGRAAVPTIWFKAAMVEAVTSLGRTISKTSVRQAFHILGPLVPVDGVKPSMREDIVRLQGISRPVDLRYRPEFPAGWRVTLTFRFNAQAISPEQLAHLLNLAGFAVGAGEWRTQKGGDMGAYHVAETEKTA